MQFNKIGSEYKYDLTTPKFQIAFAFLHREDLKELPVGWIELGHGVRAGVQHYTTMPAHELDYETHENYFDIQYLVEGEEFVGCVSREGLAVKIPYNAGNDITFYEEPQFCGNVLLHAGEFVVLAPEEAHKPRCIAGEAMPVKKIVLKVPV